MSTYLKYRLPKVIEIEQLVTLYYLEISKHTLHPGERHDFWELLYVDSGEVEITTEVRTYTLHQGDILFYKPNVFHFGRALKAHNTIVVCFDCFSEAMDHFAYQSFKVEDKERNLLAGMIEEGLRTYAPEWRNANLLESPRRPDAPVGSEQLIVSRLEELLVSFLRRKDTWHMQPQLSSSAQDNRDFALTERVISFMTARLDTDLKLNDICREFSIDRTRLGAIFKAKTGYRLMEYFHLQKIEQAKRLIRDQQYNYTEIAERLGFSGIHHFSRSFKKSTSLTPTEYARSVRARLPSQLRKS